VRTRDFQSLNRGSIPRIPTERWDSPKGLRRGGGIGRHVRLRCVCSQGLQVQVLSSASLHNKNRFAIWAVSTAVARILHTDEVTGSNPVPPILSHYHASIRLAPLFVCGPLPDLSFTRSLHDSLPFCGFLTASKLPVYTEYNGKVY